MEIELPDVVWGMVFVSMALIGIHTYLRQNRWVFKPTDKALGTPADYDMDYLDVYLKSPTQETLHGWWIAGHKFDKAVIFFHGTTGNLTYELPTIRFLNSLGISVLAVDYPGYGQSEGQPSERRLLNAADRVQQYVVQVKGYNPSSIIHFGKSLGGALAAYLSAKNRSAGLVLHGSFTSIPDLAAQLYPFFPIIKVFVRTKLNCLAWLKQCSGPLLLLHAKSDDFIPISHAHRLYQHAAVPKLFLQIAGAHDSNDWVYSNGVRQAWSELISCQFDDWVTPSIDEALQQVST